MGLTAERRLIVDYFDVEHELEDLLEYEITGLSEVSLFLKDQKQPEVNIFYSEYLHLISNVNSELIVVNVENPKNSIISELDLHQLDHPHIVPYFDIIVGSGKD